MIMPTKKPSAMLEPLRVDDWHGLAWALLLLAKSSQTGISPIGSLTLHRLQFFANSLAPVYRTRPPAAVVMKLKRGPFYPNAEDDLDTLCISGLADIRNVKWHATDGRAWKTADYDLSDSGFVLCKQLEKGSLWCENVSAFLHDLVFAYADLAEKTASDTAFRDLTYAQKGAST